MTRSLRPGPNGLPRGQVAEIQRGRLIAAAFEAARELDYERITVAELIRRARVSRKTFYELFADREDCFLAAFEHALSGAGVRARAAYARESGWREGTRAALASVLALMDQEPGLARLCVVEACAAGGRILDRRAAVLDQLAALIDRGRTLAGAGLEPPAVTAEGIVGGIFTVLHARLAHESDELLTDLLGPLMSMVVLPYLGARAARRELSRPTPAHAREQNTARPVKGADPLEGLNIRLTYRTIRVLCAIADFPGASNRAIAEAADVTDQGQISKLLGRLSRLGLVENFGEGSSKGAANAWRLTPRGAQLEARSRWR